VFKVFLVDPATDKLSFLKYNNGNSQQESIKELVDDVLE
jgi:hypothetical protein